MRGLVSGVLVLILTSVAPAQEPKPFESKAGKFQAKFPGAGKPKESERDLGKIIQYGFQVEIDKRAYDVTYFDLPAAVEAAKIFDLAEKGAVGKDKLFSSREITIGKDKLPAREVVLKKGEILLRMVMVLSGERLYLLTAGGPDDFATAKESYAFFDSFTVIK